jgi:monothiol glutaredoxin
MSSDDATSQQIESIISSNPVTLFMKGNPQAPQCGFSATVVRILDALIPDYHTVDVLSEPEIRDGIKTFSSWPTIPQLYVKGEFVGGCDIVQELFASGELEEVLGLERGVSACPTVALTEKGAEELRRTCEQSGGEGSELHLSIDARFRTALYLAPRSEGEIEVESRGVTLYLDPISARRADGVTIDVVETDRGTGFRIDNPNAPAVQPIEAQELKSRLDAGESLEFFDVRTPEERAAASIPGTVLMNGQEAKRLEALPRDTMLVFHCHHGEHGQTAAEHFAALGFRNVYNLVGGIDAWSRQIDPEVPRY